MMRVVAHSHAHRQGYLLGIGKGCWAYVKRKVHRAKIGKIIGLAPHTPRNDKLLGAKYEYFIFFAYLYAKLYIRECVGAQALATKIIVINDELQ
jgi:hypothetical protein